MKEFVLIEIDILNNPLQRYKFAPPAAASVTEWAKWVVELF
jgi:hypothetical protein